jgi:peptidoglycan/LPS O-acetylase OafA/YrhL
MAGAKARLLATLDVRRHAVRGFAASAVLTAAVLAFFVLIPGSVHPTPYYLALAVVLALSLGALLTAVLIARRAVRLARDS